MIMIKWGEEDCLTDLFGPDAHAKWEWLKDATHDDAMMFVVGLKGEDRLKLFRSMGEGIYERVDDPQPGDAAIGNFTMATSDDYELPRPWFAMMGEDYHWYIRMPYGRRVVGHDGNIEVYRKCHQ